MTNLIEFVKAVGPAVGITAAVVLLGVLGTVLGRWGAKKVWKERFVKLFHIKPEDTYTARKFQQPTVDRVLRSLARAFDTMVKKENALVDAYTGTPTRVSEEYDLKEYKKNKERLLAAKTEFWTAHKAAALMGFSIRKKYTDYLTS